MCGAPEDGAASRLLGEHGAEASLVRQTPDHGGEPPAEFQQHMHCPGTAQLPAYHTGQWTS